MNAAGSFKILRMLLLAQIREQPGRFFVTVLALALGVALGSSVYLVNTSALNEFGLAAKRLVGEADVVIRGPREGFPEQLYVDLARNDSVSAASPVLELEAALSKRNDTLKILGVDPLRAAALQPALIGDIGEALFQLFEPETIYLSEPAARALKLRRGEHLEVTVGSSSRTLRVLGILAPETYPQPLGLMDIASAQWLFNAAGRLNRIDLRLTPGTDVDSFRKGMGERLPPGVLAIAPQVERDRAVSVTRAYRVNLNMLALVALFTGAFLVFSTQSLSVLRRRRSLALLRALGVTQNQLRRALVGEGLALGVVGAVLLVPTVTLKTLELTPPSRRIVLDTAIAQLRENVGLSALSLASIIVSFSLMVAMAIMIHSFRVSFDHWLGKLLPADVQLREPFGNDTAYWSPAEQLQLAQTPGVSRVEFRRTRQLLLDPQRAPVTLIARGANDAQTAADLPLVQSAPLPQDQQPAWISEAFQDLYGYKVGDTLSLPLAGRTRPFMIAGIWRDYARLSGSIVVSLPAYQAATGDQRANEGSIWLLPNADLAATERLLRARVADGDALEITTTTALHERSLQIFDRAFAVTYALEVIAVIIGLTGVSFAASSTALARRAEFGMLRHVGMLRRQIIGMLADEGVLTSAFGVFYGLALGGALSLVLVYVVNRQSFNWSIDLAVPAWQLGLLSLALIGAAAITAIWSGRAALSEDAVRAVREDW
jgi:ABC-type lipoprotein release transport system permease subunit